MRANFADVDEFSRLPEGRYHMKVVDGKEYPSKKVPENTAIIFELEVQSGNEQGETHKHRCSVDTEGQMKFTKGFFRVCGYEGDLDADDLELAPEDLFGAEIVGDIVHNGNFANLNNIVEYNPDEDYDLD